MSNSVLDNFEEIVYTKPSDIILNQIKNLITSGQLKPGERLPSERKLSEKLQVSRSAVRDALRKLEFYGILKTQPQSGTRVAGIGVTALQGLISDILKVDGSDFKSLVETRLILEISSAQLAAERRTNDDIERIREALDNYQNRCLLGHTNVEEDLRFHLEIAEASKNKVLKSMMMIIIPDIIHIYQKLNVCGNGRDNKSLDQHREILDCIIKQKPDDAAEAMKVHLKDVVEFSLTYKQ